MHEVDTQHLLLPRFYAALYRSRFMQMLRRMHRVYNQQDSTHINRWAGKGEVPIGITLQSLKRRLLSARVEEGKGHNYIAGVSFQI